MVVAPKRQIQTFGNTTFRFQLVTELMDRAHEVRIRYGTIQAQKPQIITPQHYAKLLLEGFGSDAEEFADWLSKQPASRLPAVAALKYGFQIRRTDMRETVVHQPLEEVLDQLTIAAEGLEDPLSAVIQGVEEGWEIGLLKLTIDLVHGSAGANWGDLRQHGL